MKEKSPMTFERACALYVYRYTMEYVPVWARSRALNGLFYAPQYRTDLEWYARTLFPPHNPMGPREQSCYSSNQTWPMGHWLNRRYEKGRP